jgi:hypothetical protein
LFIAIKYAVSKCNARRRGRRRRRRGALIIARTT